MYQSVLYYCNRIPKAGGTFIKKRSVFSSRLWCFNSDGLLAGRVPRLCVTPYAHASDSLSFALSPSLKATNIHGWMELHLDDHV